VVGTIGLLVVSNVVSNRFVTGWGYVPWNMAIAVVLVTAARRWDHLTWADLGLARRDLGRGLRWGFVLAGLVAIVYLVAVAVPDLRDLFRDRRVGQRSAAAMVAEVLVRIPIGTVLLEEVAFRGVLLAQIRRRIGAARALAAMALAFGLWHVLPAWGINKVNPVVQSADMSRAAAVIGAVVATALAALPMGWVRLRSRSLVAPVCLHTATNSLGFLVAWLVLRWS
jgi:membrane protease YdiL (CAAX protease family)